MIYVHVTRPIVLAAVSGCKPVRVGLWTMLCRSHHPPNTLLSRSVDRTRYQKAQWAFLFAGSAIRPGLPSRKKVAVRATAVRPPANGRPSTVLCNCWWIL